MMIKRFLSLTLLALLSLSALAQEPSATNELNQLQLLLEDLSSDEETQDIQQLIDELTPLLERKIHINTATPLQLEPLFFLSPLQQAALMSYRERYGEILSPYELPLVDGFDLATAQLAALFLDFSPDDGTARRIYNRHELMARSSNLVQQQAGYRSGKFEGDAHRLYLRYRGNVQRLEFGFTGEKDPGEAFARGANPQGFDYNSGFALWTLKSGKSKIIIGDYTVQWGQGLAMWQGFSAGKSSDATQIARLNEGIKPYSSTDENNFMRGVAAQIRLGKHWELMPFYSFKSLDANIDTVSVFIVATSMQSSGLHRTASEIADKHSLQSISTGAKLNYRAGALKAGLSFHRSLFSLPIHPPDQAYNKYLFHGDTQQIIAASYQYNFNHLFLFGETSFDWAGLATLHGMQWQPLSLLSLAVQQRAISKNYNAAYASAQTESSRVNDEHGLFIGAKYSPLAKLTLDAYADFFRFDWVKYSTAAPGGGQEYKLQAEYQLSPFWQLNARYFYEVKSQKITADNIAHNADRRRQSLRLQLQGELNQHLKLRTRMEQNNYSLSEKTSGYLVAQDVGFFSTNENFKSWFRLAYFHTDDYNSRVYAYENDLRYQFYIPSFYGEGIRSYITLNYRIHRRWQFELKYSETIYFNQESIGSGTTQIEGNRRSEWKAQVRWKI